MQLCDHKWHVRQLQLNSDEEAVRDICKNVYGGTDYLPRMLKEYAAAGDHVLMLVAEHQDNGQVDGIVCADLRGDTVFVFGLRVKESARGHGLGHKLMDSLCTTAPTHFAQLSKRGVRSLTTVTVQYNSAAQHIISRKLPLLVSRWDKWPISEQITHYESHIGWPAHQATPEENMLDLVPGARHALESDAKAVSLVPQFRQASSTAEVAEVLRRVREQHWRMAAGSQSQDNGDGQQHPPALGSMPDTLSTYLPFFYDLQPVDSDWGQQQVEEKRIWVLESQSNGGCHEGVLVMAPSVEGRRWTAGIVATSSAVLHAALLLAGSLQPHWLAFIDVGHLYLTSKPEEARDVKSAPLYSALAEDVPSVYAATGGVGDCLVYASILS